MIRPSGTASGPFIGSHVPVGFDVPDETLWRAFQSTIATKMRALS